jgi:D-threo-aldose 1-dehydrogenase
MSDSIQCLFIVEVAVNAMHAGDVRRFTTRGGHRLEFTALGFGAAQIGNYLRPLRDEDCAATLAEAWSAGVRYYDTAPFYGLGLSEQRLGRMLCSYPRDDFVISTKVGRVLDPCAPGEENGILFVDTPQVRFSYDYSYDGIMRSFAESLGRLGLDRIDILFVHDLDTLVHGAEDVVEGYLRELVDGGGWRALEELRDSGDVAAIGAGVNRWEACVRMLRETDPDLFLLAGRYTLLEQQPLDELFPQCEARGVGLVAGGPYNSGVLAGRNTFDYGDIPAHVAARMAALTGVCERHGVDIGAAALQFVLGHPLVVSVIPGSQTQQEMQDNATKLASPIPAEFWEALRSAGLIDPRAPTPG